MFNFFKKQHKFDAVIKTTDYNFEVDVNVPVSLTEIETVGKWAEQQSNPIGLMHFIHKKIKNGVNSNNANDFVVYAVLHCYINEVPFKVYKIAE